MYTSVRKDVQIANLMNIANCQQTQLNPILSRASKDAYINLDLVITSRLVYYYCNY